jgi:hypothetical protein
MHIVVLICGEFRWLGQIRSGGDKAAGVAVSSSKQTKRVLCHRLAFVSFRVVWSSLRCVRLAYLIFRENMFSTAARGFAATAAAFTGGIVAVS